MANTNEEHPFNLNDIEDVRIILRANGKHYHLIATENKEENKKARIEAVHQLFNLAGYKVLLPALEDID